MGLKETQAALARLLTETELRERFFAAPDAIGAQLGLDPEETCQMRLLTASKAGAMALSLQSKRRQEVVKLLPRTCALLGSGFAPLFRRFAADFTPRGVNKHREDAQTFAAFLLQSPALRSASVWRRDLLRYEAAWLQLEGRRFMARLFFYDTRAITEADAAHQRLRPSPVALIWFRSSQKANWRVVCLRLPRRRAAPSETAAIVSDSSGP